VSPRTRTARGPRALLAAAVLATGLGGTSVSLPAAGAATGRCSGGTGVTVVVDYGPLGPGTEIGCDPDGGGRAASQVVPAAGFPLSYVSGQPFVCRVKGLPGPSTEDCNGTPPANAYWGLFWSDGRSGRWVYSSEGVSSLDVPDGGSIGWRFEDGGARENPGVAPTVGGRTSSPTPSPTPSKPHPSTPPAGGSTGSGGTGSAPAPSAIPDDRTGARTHGRGTTKGQTGPSKQGKQGKQVHKRSQHDRRDTHGARDHGLAQQQSAGEAVTESTPLVEPTASARASTSNPALMFLAGGAILAMAGAAVVVARRRRS
jgi:hypothetical protein